MEGCVGAVARAAASSSCDGTAVLAWVTVGVCGTGPTTSPFVAVSALTERVQRTPDGSSSREREALEAIVAALRARRVDGHSSGVSEQVGSIRSGITQK